MKVRTKLFIGFSVLMALLWAVGLLSWGIFGSLNRQFSTVEEDIIPDTIAMTEVEMITSDIYRNATDYFYHNMEDAKDEALLQLERLAEIRLEYLPTTMSETLEHGKDPVLADKIHDFYHSTISIIDLKERGFDYDTLLAYDRSMILPPLLAMQQRANEFNEASMAELTMVNASFDNAYNGGLYSIYISVVLISILSIAAGIFVSKSIVRPLIALRKGTEMIARGNLDYKVGTKAKDEIGELSRAFDKMTQSLSTSMTSIDNLNQEITERKQAEEALKESEERFSKAFRSSPETIAITTFKEGKFLEVNDSFTRLTGYTREEVIGRSSNDINVWVNANDRAKMLKILKKEGRVYSEEFDFRMKSGEIRNWLFSADKINISGEPCLISMTADITGRKRAEKLQQDENYVLTLLGQGAELSELLDAIVRLGESYDPAIKGSVLLYDSSKELLFQAAAPSLPASYLKLLENGLPVGPNMGSCGTAAFLKERVIVPEIENSPLFPYEEVVRQAMDNGLLACWSQPIISSSGELLGTIANYKNKVGEPSADNLRVLEWSARIAAIAIEHKRAEEALAYEAIWRRILIEQSRDGIVILDENSKVYEANQRFCEMLGYSPEEVRELHTWDWDTQYTREELLEMGRNVDAEGLHVETYHKRKDGTFLDVDISINGAVCGDKKFIFCVCRDVTERKQAEEALRESEEKFSAAFHSSPDMTTLVNLKTGKYTEVNDSFVNFSGYSREELIGHTNQEFNMWVKPEEEEKIGRLLDETGQMRHGEYQFRTKSGEIRIWLCSADIINIGGDPCMLAVATDITERKKAQEALHESEERFSKVFHASPGSMSISRLKDGIFIEVNDSFLKDKGYTREEVIGHSSVELGIWKDEEHRINMLQTLREQGKVRNKLTQFYTKTGELRTGYLSAEFITLGNEPCMIVLTTDITKLKQAEEQLRLLGSVTQQVSDSTIVIDTNFKITYMNQAAQDLFGYTLEEARGNMLGLFDARPMTRKERDAIKRAITSGKALNSISNKRHKDGSTIICDCRLSPLFDENGEICSYIDVQRDITKQKEVEAKLQVHKQLIERILATMPKGVLVIGSNNRILLANEAFQKIFHTGKKAISNKLLNEIIPVKQLHNLYMAVKKGNEENNTLEFRYQVKELEKRIACVITQMDGERMLLTFSDVSHEREEEEKLYLTDRLASIGEMAAGLVHELNNPLTGILALSQLLMDSELPEEYREDLECVYSEAKRAAGIVKNVLLFTRNNNYENGRASSNEVVRDVLRLREYEEKVSNITATMKLQEDLPDIPMDKFQLQQVFLNIILNAEAAIKETDKPGMLTVTTERVNNHVNIHFKDNGCGIDKHTLPRIFDPFFTTKEIGKGTGLGLSICYGIIVKNGGKISVKTNINKGTTFTIKMPVVPQTV